MLRNLLIVATVLGTISCKTPSSDSDPKVDYRVDEEIDAEPVENLARTIYALESTGKIKLKEILTILGLSSADLSRVLQLRNNPYGFYRCFNSKNPESKNCILSQTAPSNSRLENIIIEGKTRAIILDQTITIKIRLEKKPETQIEICSVDGIAIGANKSYYFLDYLKQEVKGGRLTLKDKNNTKAVYAVFDIGSGGSYETPKGTCAKVFP